MLVLFMSIARMSAGETCTGEQKTVSVKEQTGSAAATAVASSANDKEEVIGGFSVSGRTVPMSRMEAELIVPRPALRPVKSMMDTDAMVIDTLDTVNEHVKVVLYSDNTWQYVKDADYMMQADVFTEYWDRYSTDPYKMDYDSLENVWSLWVVDSLSQYHCPYQGDVHPRGKFGIRRGRRHQGVDLPLATGTPVHAAFDGEVRVSRYAGEYGNLVVIRHQNGLETFYGHLSERKVKSGDWVHAGDVIGLGGSTGRSTGPHLHFETRYKGFAFDPQWLIDFGTGDLRYRLFVLKKKYFSPYSNYEQDFEAEMLNAADDRREDAEKAAMKYYTIRPGDTLTKIAAGNGTSVSSLCSLNGITPKTVLRIGRTIRVK